MSTQFNYVMKDNGQISTTKKRCKSAQRFGSAHTFAKMSSQGGYFDYGGEFTRTKEQFYADMTNFKQCRDMRVFQLR